MHRVLTLVSAVALSAGLAQTAAAQNPPSPPSTERPSVPSTDPIVRAPSAATTDHAQKMTMTGELSSVDPMAKTLTVKTTEGREVKFSYTDSTEITGVKEQAAGLATAAGSKVSVEYTGSGDSMKATKIKVLPTKTS